MQARRKLESPAGENVAVFGGAGGHAPGGDDEVVREQEALPHSLLLALEAGQARPVRALVVRELDQSTWAGTTAKSLACPIHFLKM